MPKKTNAAPVGESSSTKIRASDLKNLRDLKAISKVLERLRPVGAERDAAGNRQLYMNDYCLLVLLWLFNPIVDSLRGLQQASDLDVVRKRLGVGRASLGSLSESVSIFDPEPLQAIVEEWSEKLPMRVPTEFGPVDKQVTAVDGSVFRVLTQIAKLAWIPGKQGKSTCGYRMHTQFEVFRGFPNKIQFTPAKPKGEADERVVLEKSVEAGRCYLMDRGYEKYALWNAIQHAGSDYVCRIRDNPVYKVLRDVPLSDQAREDQVVSDQIVQFGGEDTRTVLPDHETRLVIVKVKPHDSRSRKNAQHGPSCDGYLRIATNNLSIPAELVAALYSLRWTIELFFRLIKQLLGCRHLLSFKENGVTIQIYMAIIACIMILSYTGKMPTKRTYEMICFYLMGWASISELEAHILKLNAVKT
ncbi:MAG: IS4 family transposase [Pirellulales bacterium]